jgi:hypothetical protein
MSERLREATDRVARLLSEIERHTAYAIRHGGVGRVWLQKHYGLKESEARWIVNYFTDESTKKPEPLFSEKTKYAYDDHHDIYVIYARNGRAIEIEGHDLRDIRRKYSNWTGDYQTVKEIAFDHAHISLRDIKEILFAMGIIHDSSPFTDEEIEGSPREDLLKQLTGMEKVKIAKEWERHKIETAFQKAKEFDLLQYKQELNRKELIESLQSIIPSIDRDDPNWLLDETTDPNFVAIVQPADIHFGKLGTLATSGSHYNRHVCYKTILKETYTVLDRVCQFGSPKAIHLTVAHDWFHVDSYQGTTTKGTRQDIDGHVLTIMREGKQLAIDVVEVCLQYSSKVVINAALSNHDLMHGAGLIDYLEAYYHHDERVEVITSLRMRQYFLYGDTLIGITHGHGPKQNKDLAILMAQEAPELWGKSKFREIFTGHVHYHSSNEVLKDIDNKGIRIWSLPSLSGTDHWHEVNGFVQSIRSIQAHMISEREGHIGFFSSNVIDRLSEGFDLSHLLQEDTT